MSVLTSKQPGIVAIQYLSTALILVGYLAGALPVLVPLLIWKTLRRAAA
ncbi:MAG TPA: hypothetical protein PK375_05305 [Rhodocyclaceae bacterium]|nr:hypothetical protein [Rhodocyclaceae bacterium]HNH35308.1 hypothetical protein [Rhodocyclaceae bacterium]